MHSTIERSSRNIAVYTPNQWAQQIRSAKRIHSRYSVKELDKTDFYNFKKGAKFVLDTEREKIKWLKVKQKIQTNSRPTYIVKVYYDYGESCRKLNLAQKLRAMS